MKAKTMITPQNGASTLETIAALKPTATTGDDWVVAKGVDRQCGAQEDGRP